MSRRSQKRREKRTVQETGVIGKGKGREKVYGLEVNDVRKNHGVSKGNNKGSLARKVCRVKGGK